MPETPYDDQRIKANDLIIRRIDPAEHLVKEENGSLRVSSKAFRNSSGESGGMSVDIESFMIKHGVNPKEFVQTPKYPAAVSFKAQQIRGLGLLVGGDPTPDNPYHGQVWRGKEAKRFTKAQSRGLRQAASWYLPLPEVSII